MWLLKISRDTYAVYVRRTDGSVCLLTIAELSGLPAGCIVGACEPDGTPTERDL